MGVTFQKKQDCEVTKHSDKPKEQWTYSFISKTFQEAISSPVGDKVSSALSPEACLLGQWAASPPGVVRSDLHTKEMRLPFQAGS